VLMLNFSDFPSNLFPQLDATAAFFFADFRSSSRKLASYPSAIFQNAFRRRLPSKSESWRCEKEAFVRDFPQKLQELKMWQRSFRVRPLI
jgi:hypothetical protein